MSRPAIIGTITEIKNNENRVGLTPAGVKQLVDQGHRVFVQRHCGKGARFHDHDYEQAGAEIKVTPEEVVPAVDILVKVKEPVPEEYHLLELMKGKTLYTYLHLSGVAPELTQKLIENEITGIAYETVEDSNGGLPLLAPMSEIAGVLAAQYGAEYLQMKYHGRGKTLGEIRNASKSKVAVFGAGIVGKTAAKTAAGMGCLVTILDINEQVLEQAKKELHAYLGDYLFQHVSFVKSDKETASEAVAWCDLLVGAVLVAGARAPIVVDKEQVHLMKDGAVIVDVSIDQGGCIWGSKATTHSEPTYEIDNKIYCCVANMPGQVAYQSTQALTNATLPYLLKLANEGVEAALTSDAGFLKGLNTYKGKIVYEPVAQDLGRMDDFAPVLDLIGSTNSVSA